MMTTHAEMIERLGAYQMPMPITIRLYRAFGAVNLTVRLFGKCRLRIMLWA